MIMSRAQQIQAFCHSRGITTVVHFTRLCNLPSIINDGLIPRALLDGDVVPFNDAYRYDEYLEANCMSISFPNYQMFYSCRENHDNTDARWIVFTVDARVLWELDCAFCIENASSNSVRRIPLEQRKSLGALQKMFDDYTFENRTVTRSELGVPESYPTHPQAEVLVFDTVPLKYFRAVHFEKKSDHQKYEATLSPLRNNLNVFIKRDLFLYRKDWVKWR